MVKDLFIKRMAWLIPAGTTSLYVKNTGEMTGNSRNVKSTIGFFAR